VLLELFILLGPSCLSHLRGMFAFAIWDDVKKELFLARDSYGIKPLYFIEESNHFSFASQISALINKRDDLRVVEPAGVVGFYLMGSVPDPWTIYKNIFSLEKGSYLIVRNGKIVSKTLWNNFASNWNSEVNSKNIINDVSNAVQDSVSSHLIADVPVSVFLSGGIDSSVIASLAADSTKVTGINISFNEFQGTKDDELPLAKSVAESLNIDFLNKVITKEEFESDFDEIISSIGST
jgi:asparagine synthase (glutamine-hydrolysing)